MNKASRIVVIITAITFTYWPLKLLGWLAIQIYNINPLPVVITNVTLLIIAVCFVVIAFVMEEMCWRHLQQEAKKRKH